MLVLEVMGMSRRYLYAGLGILALAAALAIPAMVQPGRVPAGRRWGPGRVSAQSVRGPVTIDTAVQRVRVVLAAGGYTDLVPKEVMEFSNHFYVLVAEKSTGRGALELLVLRNGLVRPEPGPNMMWNTKYGHMAAFGRGGPGWGPGMMGPGMMGPGGPQAGPGWGPGWGPYAQGQVPAQTVSRERARQLAGQYLAATFPGATTDEGTAFYGYYTFDAERDGETFGMLSVNAYTGQVWYHSWHGRFIQEKEL